MIQLGMNNEITFDGQPTGYAVRQGDAGNATVVYSLDGSRGGLGMPRSHYSLTHGMPSYGVAGRAEFERDFCAVTGRVVPQNTLTKLEAYELVAVLLQYPKKALVSDLYDSDDVFSSAIIGVVGDSFEYPDYSYKTVDSVVQSAIKKSEYLESPKEAKPSFSICKKQNENRLEYVNKILAKYESGKDNVYESFKFVYAASHRQSTVESDVNYVRRCAEQDYEDAARYPTLSDKSKPVADFLNGHPDEALALNLYQSSPSFRNAMDLFVTDLAAANKHAEQVILDSALEAEAVAHEKGSYAVIDANVNRALLGKILAVTDSHVVMSLGRSAAIIAQSDLNRVPSVGEDATIVFRGGKGIVADCDRFTGEILGR